MSITGMHHIVIRVKDFDEGVKTYRDDLGMELDSILETEALGVKQAIFKFADGGFLEVVAPLTADSPVGKAIAGKGEGIHTVSLAVDDLDATIKDMEAKGVKLIGAGSGGQVYVHPKSAHGVLVQLSQK